MDKRTDDKMVEDKRLLWRWKAFMFGFGAPLIGYLAVAIGGVSDPKSFTLSGLSIEGLGVFFLVFALFKDPPPPPARHRDRKAERQQWVENLVMGWAGRVGFGLVCAGLVGQLVGTSLG